MDLEKRLNLVGESREALRADEVVVAGQRWEAASPEILGSNAAART